jgi:alkylglycerol monooxygenase
VPPVYGVTRPVRTWNPWLINYMHLWLLIQDAWRTTVWKNKVFIWFMPTGWRPADVASRYPVVTITDVDQRLKYETRGSAFFRIWMVCQLFITLSLMLYLFSVIGELNFNTILLYGVFLFVTVFAYTSLMDGSVMGLVAEMIKFSVGAMILWFQGGHWFGLNERLSGGTYFVTLYLGLSLLLAIYFYFVDRPVPVTLEEDYLVPEIA